MFDRCSSQEVREKPSAGKFVGALRTNCQQFYVVSFIDLHGYYLMPMSLVIWARGAYLQKAG